MLLSIFLQSSPYLMLTFRFSLVEHETNSSKTMTMIVSAESINPNTQDQDCTSRKEMFHSFNICFNTKGHGKEI